MSSAVCRILPFPALCVPEQLTEDAWKVRSGNSDPSKRDSAKQRGAVNRKTECAAHSRGTYRGQLPSTVSQKLSIRPLSEGLDCLVAFSEEQDDEEAVRELHAPDVRVVQVESRPGSDSAV